MPRTPDQELLTKIVVASSIRQAELAARQLGLGRNEWRYASSVRDVEGVACDTEVVLALPELGAIREYAELREMMKARNFKVKEVWT